MHDEFDVASAEYLTHYRKIGSPKTVQRKMGTFRRYAKFAGFDALDDYRAPTPAKNLSHPLPNLADDVIDMCDVAAAESDELAALIAMCGLQGMRVSEARSSHIKWFDLTNRTIRVQGKGDKERVIPLYDSAFDYITMAYVAAKQTNHGQLVTYSDSGARAAITRIGTAAGVGRAVSSHDLRHTFGTAAYLREKNILAVQNLMGHESVETTRTYINTTMEAMRQSGDIAGGDL